MGSELVSVCCLFPVLCRPHALLYSDDILFETIDQPAERCSKGQQPTEFVNYVMMKKLESSCIVFCVPVLHSFSSVLRIRLVARDFASIIPLTRAIDKTPPKLRPPNLALLRATGLLPIMPKALPTPTLPLNGLFPIAKPSGKSS